MNVYVRYVSLPRALVQGSAAGGPRNRARFPIGMGWSGTICHAQRTFLVLLLSMLLSVQRCHRPQRPPRRFEIKASGVAKARPCGGAAAAVARGARGFGRIGVQLACWGPGGMTEPKYPSSTRTEAPCPIRKGVRSARNCTSRAPPSDSTAKAHGPAP